MYVSRLLFHTVPGKTGEVEQELKKLRDMVRSAGGAQGRVLHTHFASPGAPDAVFRTGSARPLRVGRTDQKAHKQRRLPDAESPNVRSAHPIAEAGSLHRRGLNSLKCTGLGSLSSPVITEDLWPTSNIRKDCFPPTPM